MKIYLYFTSIRYVSDNPVDNFAIQTKISHATKVSNSKQMYF